MRMGMEMDEVCTRHRSHYSRSIIWDVSAHFLIGIDEAGRGPLAGPVAVGAVIVAEGFDVLQAFPKVRDSKVLSEKVREEIYAQLEERAALGDVKFCVQFSSHTYIDEYGITKAVHTALTRGVFELAPQPSHVKVFLDGLLHAPKEYEQETIIRGDALVPLISLASVVAKVSRDRLMLQNAEMFPRYGFEQHKGYGTLAHRKAIQEFGLCDLHRRSFCRAFNDVLSIPAKSV